MHEPALLRLLEGYPVRVSETAEAGRRLVAARDLAAGELVLASLPFGRVAYPVAARHWCTQCNGLSPSAQLRLACSGGCGLYFCSQACRRAAIHHGGDWCALRTELRVRNGVPMPPLCEEAATLAQLLVDILSRAACEPGLEGVCVEPGAPLALPPRLDDLLELYTPDAQHLAEHGLSAWADTWRDVAVETASAAAAAAPALVLPSLEMLAVIASKDLSNSFGLWDRTHACKEAKHRGGGHALFLSAALLNHSCLPSLYHTHHRVGTEAVMVLRALRPLREGEELSIRYVDPRGGDYERRKVFTETWGFACACARCEGDEADRAAAAEAWDGAFLCGCGYGRPGGGPGIGAKPLKRSHCVCPVPWILPQHAPAA
jgi:SET domain